MPHLLIPIGFKGVIVRPRKRKHEKDRNAARDVPWSLHLRPCWRSLALSFCLSLSLLFVSCTSTVVRSVRSSLMFRFVFFNSLLFFDFFFFLNQFFCLEIILFFPCFRRKRVQITFYEESGILGFFGFLKRTLFSRSSIKRPVEIRTARFQIWKYYGKLSEREREKRERESGERERGKVVGAAVTSAYPAQDRETTGVSEFYLFHNCIRCLLALGLKIQERQFPPSFHFRLV